VKRNLLTPSRLRRIIAEEKKKLESAESVASKTEEIPAGGYAEALVNHIDYIKALGIKEAKLKSQLKKLNEIENRIKRSLSKRNR